jgi:hypothetical protein
LEHLATQRTGAQRFGFRSLVGMTTLQSVHGNMYVIASSRN